MIRNSTDKYKKIHQTFSSQKFSRSSKNIQSLTNLQILSMNSFNLKPSKSVAKLESINKKFAQTQTVLTSYQSRQTPTRKSIKLVSRKKFEQEVLNALNKKRQMANEQIAFSNSKKLRKTSKKPETKRDPQDFIEKLPKNSLFFCCACYYYVFEIQKHRHYPHCKDILLKPMSDNIEIGIKRLQKLVELAEYTKASIQQIYQYYQDFKKGDHLKLSELYYPKYSFFVLEQICYAFAWTYDQLLRNKTFQSDSIFNCI